MKIALVRRGWSASGGAEAYLRRLASGLQTRGHIPVLLGSPEWPEDQWVNSEIRRLPGRRPSAFARDAQAAARGCDLVFSMERIGACDIYRAGDGVHAAWQKRRAPFEPKWKQWVRYFNRKNRELLELERQTFDSSGARFVIANSRMVANEISETFPAAENRIRVVQNGISPVTPTPGEREERRRVLGVSKDETLLLFAGSGWERKGLRFAVEAARGLAAVRLVVAGRGRVRGDVPSQVQFLGPVREMDALYAAADVFVLPTVYDPFSNACLEALAHGLPVITTDANGFSEIMQREVHGSVVRVGDVPALRNAMIAWSDPLKRLPARSACIGLSSACSMDENVRKTLEIIDLATVR